MFLCIFFVVLCGAVVLKHQNEDHKFKNTTKNAWLQIYSLQI